MTNEAVRRDLTDEALEALHQTALNAVRNRAGQLNELLAADAASSAIERLVKEVEDGHVIRDREAYVKKAAQDWVDAPLNLTTENLKDLHQAALGGARAVGGRLERESSVSLEQNHALGHSPGSEPVLSKEREARKYKEI